MSFNVDHSKTFPRKKETKKAATNIVGMMSLSLALTTLTALVVTANCLSTVLLRCFLRTRRHQKANSIWAYSLVNACLLNAYLYV